MYIYKWVAGLNASKGDNLVVNEAHSNKCDDFILDGENKSIKGIDKIKSDNDSEGIKDCVKFAISKIPTDRHSRTYIYLAATAGMRILEY